MIYNWTFKNTNKVSIIIIPVKFLILSHAQITRGSQAECDFTLVINLSIGFVSSCLATSHKIMLKTPFNIMSSCILGFQATGPPTWAHFIHPLFTVCWRITKYKCTSEPNNSGLQTQQCPIGQVEGNPCRARFLTHWKNGNLNFSESSEEGRPVHSLRSSNLYKAREWINMEIMWNGFEILI